MSIFGRKFDRGITRFGKKVAHGVSKFGKKLSHGIHTGLHVADKVLSTVGKVSDYVGKVGASLSSVGVPYAGLLTIGAKSVSGLAKTADKGVKGLEKATNSVEHLGNTLSKARGNIVSSNYNPSVIGSEAKRVMDANPLKNRN
jgi:DNA anti-recombination protein RmuC